MTIRNFPKNKKIHFNLDQNTNGDYIITWRDEDGKKSGILPEIYTELKEVEIKIQAMKIQYG